MDENRPYTAGDGEKMDINEIPIFRMMSGKMRWLAQRQRVLAQNIANADTPNYQPRDLKKVDFREKLGRNPFQLVLARTDPKHIQLRTADRFTAEQVRTPYETAPSGNAVVLEEQLLKVSQTGADYELMTNLYRKHIGLFRIALGRGQQ
jgi:flagellar basal-body rod protein FlgB